MTVALDYNSTDEQMDQLQLSSLCPIRARKSRLQGRSNYRCGGILPPHVTDTPIFLQKGQRSRSHGPTEISNRRRLGSALLLWRCRSLTKQYRSNLKYKRMNMHLHSNACYRILVDWMDVFHKPFSLWGLSNVTGSAQCVTQWYIVATVSTTCLVV